MNKGKIIGIKGEIAEVEFRDEMPQIHDVVVLENNPEIKMEVFTSASVSSFFCLILSPIATLSRGAIVFNTRQSLTLPMGPEVLGRVMDIFGNSQDGKGAINAHTMR